MQRAVSSAVAALLLVVLLPLLSIIGIAVWCCSPGPIIFRQKRIGYHARPFILYKFRTMIHDSGRPLEIVRSGDLRVTRLGYWLRATHLDELPQLWNIVRGEMCFVGPRPECVELTRLHIKMFPGYERRFLVPPGLTGPEQILSREWRAKNKATAVRYERAYIERKDLVLDAYILWRTLIAVLTRQGV